MSARKKAPEERIDRLPPHDLPSEQGCLGCVLLNPEHATAAMMLLIQKFPGPEVFYDLRHRTVYEFLCVMHDERAPIDIITLHQRLNAKTQLEAVGGLPYIASLPDAVPSASNVEYYADIVFDKFQLRRMVTVCTEIIGRVYDDPETALAGIESMQRDIIHTAQMTNRKGDWSVKGAVKLALQKIEADLKSGGALTGLPTGFSDLDGKTRGFQRGEYIVIAARPSLGKSSLAMNFADHWTVDCKIPVGVFSLEMSKDSLMRRMISARARIDLFRMDNDLLAGQELDKLSHVGGRLAIAPLYIEDTPGLDDVQVRSMMRQMVHEHGVQAVIIDYLQLLHSRKRIDNRAQELSHISTAIKNLGRELNVAVVVCAQLNREVDNLKGERPRMSHLKDCGGIEQDADLIGLLYATKAVEGDNVPSAIDIAKQRNGPTGPIQLLFRRNIFRFQLAAKVSDGDVPADDHGKASLPHPND